MNNKLERMNEMIDQLLTYTGTLDKKSILNRYPDLKEILKWVYDPFIKFYITGKQIEENYHLLNNLTSNTEMGMFALLELLSTRKLTGNDALFACLYFVKNNIEFKDVIIKILNKDLKCGISVKTINSVFPNLISEFEIPLAKEYNPNKHDVFNGNYLISRKLDGIRCLCFINGSEVTFLTRKGKEIWTLDKIKKEILEKYSFYTKEPIILDGELCLFENGVEDFRSISSEYRRKDHSIQNPRYYVFDIYTLSNFKQGKDSEFLDYVSKKYILEKYFKNFTHIKVLNQIPLSRNGQLSFPGNWEGLIIRKNSPSLFKRSNNLLKVKSFKEEEFTVKDIETSTMMIDGVETKTCGSLIIDYKGNEVGVGSGLDRYQRVKWFICPEEIIGKKITVKYFSESKDKNGKISLRFPTLKGVRDEY